MIVIMTGSHDTAIRLLEKARHVSRDLPGLYYILASAYLHAQKTRPALKALTEASRLDADLFDDYSVLLPSEMMTPAMKRLFRKKSDRR